MDETAGKQADVGNPPQQGDLSQGTRTRTGDLSPAEATSSATPSINFSQTFRSVRDRILVAGPEPSPLQWIPVHVKTVPAHMVGQVGFGLRLRLQHLDRQRFRPRKGLYRVRRAILTRQCLFHCAYTVTPRQASLNLSAFMTSETLGRQASERPAARPWRQSIAGFEQSDGDTD